MPAAPALISTSRDNCGNAYPCDVGLRKLPAETVRDHGPSRQTHIANPCRRRLQSDSGIAHERKKEASFLSPEMSDSPAGVTALPASSDSDGENNDPGSLRAFFTTTIERPFRSNVSDLDCLLRLASCCGMLSDVLIAWFPSVVSFAFPIRLASRKPPAPIRRAYRCQMM